MSHRFLTPRAESAFTLAHASKGKHRGKLLSKAPISTSDAYAAWQAAVGVVNPYKLSIAGMIFMSDEQRAIYNEVSAYVESLPKADQVALDRDRQALEAWGVW